MHLKIQFAKWQPFCPGGDDISIYIYMPISQVWLHRSEGIIMNICTNQSEKQDLKLHF